MSESICGVIIDDCRASTVAEVMTELKSATLMHGPMHSAHEGYSVLHEELDELWDEVKTKHRSVARMRSEAIQVAAMALRFIEDVCK